MKKGIGPHGLGAPKSAAKMYKSPAKKNGPEGKKKKSSQQMYDERDARYTAKAKLEDYAKENPRASRSMPQDQRERIRGSYERARLSELRAKRLNNK